MKWSTLLVTFVGTAFADYICPANPSTSDTTALQYAYQIQQLLTQYYESVPVNASFFSALPNAEQQASNGETLAENTVTNVEGLRKQARLASEALMQEAAISGVTMPSTCNYQLPMALNASAHLMNAFFLEASLCGAFIGLADYFQGPTLNSLSARIAAEHGIHAAAIRAMMQPVGFMPNSTNLTPAFTPEMILSGGGEVGQLGEYVGDCNIMGPRAPCDGRVAFGPLLSYLTEQSSDLAPGEVSYSSATAQPYKPSASWVATEQQSIYSSTRGPSYEFSATGSKTAELPYSSATDSLYGFSPSMTATTTAAIGTFTGGADKICVGVVMFGMAILTAWIMA